MLILIASSKLASSHLCAYSQRVGSRYFVSGPHILEPRTKGSKRINNKRGGCHECQIATPMGFRAAPLIASGNRKEAFQMKSSTKLLLIFFALISQLAIAAEDPKSTFSIWGGTPEAPVGYYNVIKNLPGQEIIGATSNCLYGADSSTFVLKGSVFDAMTGALKFEVVISASTPGLGGCAPSGFGQGIANSESKRIIILGMQNGQGNAVVNGYNAENGAEFWNLSFAPVIADPNGDFILNTREVSAVGNFINNRTDQLRVAYERYNLDGSADMKISYFNVLSGNQIGHSIDIHVAAATAP